MNNYNNNKIQIILPIVIAVSIVIGFFAAVLLFKGKDNPVIVNNAVTNKLDLVIKYVETEYVDEVDHNELEEIAIPKFLEALDPHTTYSSAEATKKMAEELEGNFDGIGVQFNIFKDTVFIVKIIEGGPSERYNVQAGDRIVKVNDSVIAGNGITNDKVMKLLKGPKGSKVTIDVKRRGYEELIPITIQRGSIPLYSVDAFYKIDNSTGYIKVLSFSRNTYAEFKNAVLKMKNEGISSIIVDLRNNGGGYMNAATNIIDEFLEAEKMIVYTEGRARGRKDIIATKEKNLFTDLNIVVLIDDFSASASEILAGAIQDNDRGFIIGRRSFGKGLVQEAINFSDGSMMRLTTARYYTPSGRSIQKPYDNGNEDYYSDIINRYTHGEFSSIDSISLNDSSVFYTSLGRKVYGGGGIMPDIFVPMDTAGYSKLYGDINRKNLSYKYSLEYVDANRNKLKSVKNISDLYNFLKVDNALEKFWNYVSSNNVKIDPQDLKISKIYIENNFTAYVARQILDENMFFEIANKYDPALDSALSVIRTNRKLIN